MKLYHYSKQDAEELILDPKRFLTAHAPYSKREYRTSHVPRTFYYLDPEQKEMWFMGGVPLYEGTYPDSKIYNLIEDSEDFIGQTKKENYNILNHDLLLRKISGWVYKNRELVRLDTPYDGVYYKISGRDIVAMFVPLKVKRIK
tara:strand:- start:622 stop:1053 length:432 start_codon:yes stop_codon:yes gene_type:complete